MAATKVDTAVLRNAANKLTELNGQYTTAYGQIYSLCAEVDQMWDGDAATKFNQVLDSDRARFKAMSDILQRYIEGLSNIAAKYEEAERQALDVATSRKA